MKKRILSILLSMMLVVGLLPTTALAVESYAVYVAGRAMTASDDGSAVSYYVNGEGGAAGSVTAEEPQSGWNAKLSYDTTEQTLVLEADGLVAPSTKVDDWTDGYGNCYGAIYSPDAPLKIVLKNNPSTIGSSGSNSGSGYGIYSSEALTIDIEVSGSTVTAPGKNTSRSGSWGIRGVGNIVINSSNPSYTLEASASGGSCGYTYGIFSNGSITFNGGTVRATGGSGSSGNDVGISANGITVNSGATVYGTGGSNGLRSYGFELGGFKTMEVNDGAAVYATGGTGGSSSAGIDLSGDLVINGGIFEAKGQSSTGGSYGVTRTSMASFTINGGQVTLSASGGATNNRACDSVTPTLPSAYGWKTSADGDLTLSSDTPYIYNEADTYLYVEVLHAHPACGATCTHNDSHSTLDSWTAWDGTTAFPGGDVYLTNDVDLAETLTISTGTVNLCLNGHSITSNSGNAIQVNSDATLNLCDCKGTGTVSATASGSRGIDNSGTVNVYGGTVSGNTYGISNSNGGNVAVSGGTVSGGTGIENYGTLTVSGGSVTGTHTYGGYGISTYGTFKLSGAPAITGGSNSADVLIHASQKVITIDGTLTYSTPISVEPYNGYSAFTGGWNDKMSDADHNDYFIPASGRWVFVEAADELKPAYTVTYDENGATSGSVPTDSSSPYSYYSTVTVLGNTGDLAKTDYTFAGWNTKADGTGTDYDADATFTITSNSTLYAKWTANTYTVTFNANGGEGTMTPQTFTAGQAQALTENTFTRTGYTFAGWNTAADGTGTGYADKESITLTVDLPLYAQWIPAAPTGLSGVKPTSSANNDGKITGTTAAMEYSTTADFASATDCGDGEITGLSSGTYYVRVKATQSKPAGAAATVTVPAYQPPYTPPSTPPTPSEPPTVQITVPVSGEENTVHVEAEVKGESASVEPVDENEVAHIAEGETEMPVTMDFSVLENDITEVKIPTQSIELISETANDPETAVTGLRIDLTYADIEFDAAALAVIAEAAKDTDEITIIVDERAAEHLTEAQRETVQDMPNALILEATVLVNGEPVHNFFGGKATVTFPYQLAAGQSAEFITVWHIADDGAKEAMRTYYDAESEEVYFVAPHLSHYVVTGDEANFAHICPSEPYTDVDQGLWYHEYVDYVIENGLMIGTDTNIFSPYGTLTRAQVVTALWRFEDEPVVNYLIPFEDVSAEQWYTEAVRWAASERIVEGYGNGNFGTNDAITREQLAAILWRYAKYKGYDVSVGEDTNILSFDDAFEISEYAYPALQWACGSGLMQGNGDGTLNPVGETKRCEFAAMLMRFIENITL